VPIRIIDIFFCVNFLEKFCELIYSQYLYFGKLALSLHENTLENDGSLEGLCSREGDA
jgi:hypothetical protein